MNKREKFLKEIAEVINRNSLEAHFNDTPDYILAKVAVEAMENFAEASARRDNWHGFKEADKPGEVVRNEDCDNRPVRGICPEHKKPEAFDVPKEVRAMAEFFGKMFPGSKVEIHRVEMPKGTHGINAGQRTKGKGATMGKSNCPGQSKPEKICGTCRYFNPEFPVNGKPAPVCLAIKEMKGGTEYSNPRGTQHYFRCSNGRYEIGISN